MMASKPTVLSLLGGFLLTVDGERREVPARKVKALMCRLAVDDAPLPREQLAALLWPDSSPAAARHSLRQALTEVRRALQGSAIGLSVTPHEAALETYGGSVDVRRFRELAAAASPEDWADAMALYRGTLLEGLDVRVDTFDEWPDATRRELAQTALSLCRALATHHEDDPAQAVVWTRRLLALDPLDEAAHRDLMRHYIATHQDGAAIRQYLHCRSLLERELDIAPEAETTALYQGLLSHRAAAERRRAAAGPVPAPDAAPDGGPVEETPAPGEPSAAAAPPGPRLRPAVVLACRLPEEDHDPELADRRRRRDGEAIALIVRSYGGRVVSQLGAQVVCGFGLGRVRGTEADRACFAGAELAAAIPGLRGGIASGQLIYRADEGALVGQAATEALALADRAAPGEILPSEAVTAARRYGAAGGESPLNEGGERLPLVGRAMEIRQFLAVLDASRDGGYGCTVLLRGEPGIGKTRLVQELAELAVREGFAVHVGRAYDFGSARGQDAIAQLVRSLLGERVDAAAISSRVGSEHLPYLQAVLGIDPEPGAAEQLDALSPLERLRLSTRAVVALVRASARDSALVLVVDDLHWADRLTLAVLPPLARAAAELPVVVVMTSRVAGEALDPEWRAAMGGAPLTTLDLQPLRPAEAERLAGALGVAEGAVGEILSRAGGNPLFIQQLARSGRAGRGLPHSIQSLAVAQLEALPEPVQAQVRAATVLGQHFDLDALSATVGEPPCLDPAVEAGLIVRREPEWGFHHALIRDGIYQNLLASDRRDLHARAASYYRDRSPTLHARHLDLADAPEAAAALVAAAADEIEHYRLASARELAERALARDPDDAPAMLVAAQLDLMTGATARAAEGFRACRDAAGGDDVRGQALVGLGMALNQLDRFDEAVEALESATALNGGDYRYQADAWLQLGNALFPQGLTTGCLRAHQTALEHAERAGCTLRQARAEGGLGDAYYQQGAMLSAYRHYDRCVTLGTAHGHPSVVPPNLAMLSLTLTYQNRFDRAVTEGGQALALAERSSNLRHQLLAHNVLASVAAFRADAEAGPFHARRTIELGERIGSRRFVLDGLSQLAHLMWGAGRVAEARATLAEAERLLDPSLLPFAGAYIRGLQAVCAADAAERRGYLAEGERLLGAEAVSHCHMYFYVCAMEACLMAGEPAEALRYAERLAAYTRAEPLPFADLFIRRARVLAQGGPAEARRAIAREARETGLGIALRLLEG